MIISKKNEGQHVTLAIEGRLDSVTSIDLQNEVSALYSAGAVHLSFDFEKVDYISSAGLRVLMLAQKKSTALGTTLDIISVTENVRKVLDMTGVSTILKIR
jgi:anti-anti-sigma factor